jgi:transposase
VDDRRRAWLADLELPAVQRAIVDDCCGLLDAITPLVARLERDLLVRAKPDPRIDALQALPGIGPITAMTLVAEIGEIGRFPTARKLCAWGGLTPAVRNLRPQGPPWPHHQARIAVGAVGAGRGRPEGQDRPPFARFYAETAARRGRQIATVAVARKLLARSFHILKDVAAPAIGEGHHAGCARDVACA